MFEQDRNKYKEAEHRYRRGDYRGALETLDGLLERYPEDPEVIYARACCLIRLGYMGEALKWGEALELMGDVRGRSILDRVNRVEGASQDTAHIEKRGVFLPLLGAALVMLLVVYIATPELVQERTFRFNAASSIGTLLYRDVPGQYLNEWRSLGPAQGEMLIPRGREAGLILSSGIALGDVPAEARRWIRRLEISAVEDGDAAELATWSSLRELRIADSPTLGDAFLRDLQGLPRLKAISLHGGVFSDTGLDYLMGMPRLESVELRELQGVTVRGVEKLFRLKSLRELDIALPHLAESMLENIANARQLRSLGFERMTIPASDIAKLAKLPHLEKLFFRENERLDDAAMEHMSQIASLRHVSLEGGAFTDAGLSQLSQLRNLRSLRLSGNHQITDDGVGYLQGRLRLNELFVVDCERVQGAMNGRANHTTPSGSRSSVSATPKEVRHEFYA